MPWCVPRYEYLAVVHRFLDSLRTCYHFVAPAGREAQTNFKILNYEQELQNLERVSTDELVLSLRRQSKGFTRGSSRFRGVTRHQKGRWEARIGQLTGRKYRYLGLFDSEVEAAIAYDREAVRQKGCVPRYGHRRCSSLTHAPSFPLPAGWMHVQISN